MKNSICCYYKGKSSNYNVIKIIFPFSWLYNSKLCVSLEVKIKVKYNVLQFRNHLKI